MRSKRSCARSICTTPCTSRRHPSRKLDVGVPNGHGRGRASAAPGSTAVPLRTTENLVMRAVELVAPPDGGSPGSRFAAGQADPDRRGPGRRLQRCRGRLGCRQRGLELGPFPERAERRQPPSWVATCRSSSPAVAAVCRGRGERGRARRGTGTVEFRRRASAGWPGHGRRLRRLPAGPTAAERAAAGAMRSAAEIFERRAGCF